MHTFSITPAPAATPSPAASPSNQQYPDSRGETDKGPVYGRQAIEKWLADDFQEWHHSNHVRKPDPNSPRIIGAADVLASNGECSVTVQGKTSARIQVQGHWSDISTRAGND